MGWENTQLSATYKLDTNNTDTITFVSLVPTSYLPRLFVSKNILFSIITITSTTYTSSSVYLRFTLHLLHCNLSTSFQSSISITVFLPSYPSLPPQPQFLPHRNTIKISHSQPPQSQFYNHRHHQRHSPTHPSTSPLPPRAQTRKFQDYKHQQKAQKLAHNPTRLPG